MEYSKFETELSGEKPVNRDKEKNLSGRWNHGERIDVTASHWNDPRSVLSKHSENVSVRFQNLSSSNLEEQERRK